MDMNKLYKAAAAAGIAPFETRISNENIITVKLFNEDVENYTVAENGSMKVRGLVDGKGGVFSSDRVDDEVIDVAVKAVKDSAEYGQPVDPEFFLGGEGLEYEDAPTFNEKLAAVPASEFIALGKTIAKKTLGADKRIESVNVQVEYSYNETRLKNSVGLDVAQKTNYVIIFGSAKAKDGDSVESGSHYEILTGIDGLDIDGFAKKLAADAADRLGGDSVKSGKYKVVYSPNCAAALLTALTDGFSAFNVEQHISLLEGKIGQKIFSPLFSLEQTPIGSEPFCSAFDSEGMPCKNALLIDKGVPTDYVYDLATAKRAGKKSTGNGVLQGGNVRPAVMYAHVLPGDKSLEELFEFVGDGLYIDDLGGIGTGLNAQSGAYSLQAGGFLIENGKLSRPVSLITVAGNIMTDFNDVIAVGNDEKTTYYGIKTPSIAIGSLSVSGK